MEFLVEWDGIVGYFRDLYFLWPRKLVYLMKSSPLAKRRGFVFQSSEIYGGLNGFFDYGPGVELRKNIKDAWWEDMVRRRDDMVGLDSGIIMNPKVWQASGHVDGFTDPMVDCKESKMRYRADQLFAAEVRVEGTSLVDLAC